MSRAARGVGIVGSACKHPLMGGWVPGCRDALDPQTARDHFVRSRLSERFRERLCTHCHLPVVWPSSILLRLARRPLRVHIPTSLQAGWQIPSYLMINTSDEGIYFTSPGPTAKGTSRELLGCCGHLIFYGVGLPSYGFLITSPSENNFSHWHFTPGSRTSSREASSQSSDDATATSRVSFGPSWSFCGQSSPPIPNWTKHFIITVEFAILNNLL